MTLKPYSSAIFDEYTQMLMEADNNFKSYLELQGYADELENLNLKYGLPNGRFYIAFLNKQLAGRIALRQLAEKHCEMKRLYVKPRYRGKKIAKTLIDLVINEAIDIGYDYMMLDTLPVLEDAIRIYKIFGFYEIPQYNDSPVKDTVFLKLDLNS